MKPFDGQSIIQSFNDCITRRDIDGLAELMTPDHVFTDAANRSVSGKNQCLEAWAGFFAAFPDYQNVFDEITITEDEAVIAGYSVCSDRRLAGPAIWTAKIQGGLIREWRVYEDNATNRALLLMKR
jgi:ketosteroid isomerase-like protein